MAVSPGAALEDWYLEAIAAHGGVPPAVWKLPKGEAISVTIHHAGQSHQVDWRHEEGGDTWAWIGCKVVANAPYAKTFDSSIAEIVGVVNAVKEMLDAQWWLLFSSFDGWWVAGCPAEMGPAGLHGLLVPESSIAIRTVRVLKHGRRLGDIPLKQTITINPTDTFQMVVPKEMMNKWPSN